MLRVIVPVAGSSEMFKSAGYHYPKPLIEISEVPMIQLVLANPMQLQEGASFLFLLREEECIKYHLDNVIKLLIPDSIILKLKSETKGGLCSVLMAADEINQDDELLILNSDQVIDIDFGEVIQHFRSKNADSGVVTFESVHPRWSYLRTEGGKVVESAEKNPISNQAIAGFYYFKSAKEFMECAYNAIFNDANHNGLYYISSVLNELILLNKNVLCYSIDANQYHSFYSPQKIWQFTQKGSNGDL